MKDAEWDYWLALDTWDLREATLLLEGKNPDLVNPPYSGFFYSVEDKAIRANEAGFLKTISGKQLVHTTNVKLILKHEKYWNTEKYSIPSYRLPKKQEDYYKEEHVITEEGEVVRFIPRDFLLWARGKGIQINKTLESFFLNGGQEEDIMDNAENLSQSERRRLGQLNDKVEKIPFLIKASVAAALHVASIGSSVIKDTILEGIRNAGLPADSLTDEELNYIWKALPPELQHHGRPKKIAETGCRLKDAER